MTKSAGKTKVTKSRKSKGGRADVKKRPIGVTAFCIMQWLRYTFFFTLLLFVTTSFINVEMVIPLTVSLAILVICLYFIKLTLDVWELNYNAWESYLKLYILVLSTSILSIVLTYKDSSLASQIGIASGIMLEGFFGLWLYDIRRYMQNPGEGRDFEDIRSENDKTPEIVEATRTKPKKAAAKKPAKKTVKKKVAKKAAAKKKK